MERYRKCFVPTCNNNSKNSNKTLVRIREDLRQKWCHEVNIKYFKVYAQYCCEDHFDPKQDLINYYYKSENKEPRFKPTAKLRNLPINLRSFASNSTLRNTIEDNEEIEQGAQKDLHMQSNALTIQSQPGESKLAKLLLQPGMHIRKRPYEDMNMPSTSGVISSQPFKVQVPVQATVTMANKSTNTYFDSSKLRSAVELHSSEQRFSTSDSPSLFSFTSESEGTEMLVKKDIRKINLEKNYKKPKMFLGLPKQNIGIIDFIVEKSSSKIDSLYIIVTLLKIKQNETIERINDELEISRTKLSSTIRVYSCFFRILLNKLKKIVKSTIIFGRLKRGAVLRFYSMTSPSTVNVSVNGKRESKNSDTILI